MFQITLLAMGKLKEKFYLSAAAEYEKRLSGVCRFQLLELPECRLPESPQPAEIAMGLAKEGELIRQKIPKGAWFCVLTPEGKELSSEAFAGQLALQSAAGLVHHALHLLRHSRHRRGKRWCGDDVHHDCHSHRPHCFPGHLPAHRLPETDRRPGIPG